MSVKSRETVCMCWPSGRVDNARVCGRLRFEFTSLNVAITKTIIS